MAADTKKYYYLWVKNLSTGETITQINLPSLRTVRRHSTNFTNIYRESWEEFHVSIEIREQDHFFSDEEWNKWGLS